MVIAVFRNKVGGSERLLAEPGQSIRDLLRTYGIPKNAVITLKNGKIVSEDVSLVEPDDYIEFWQVRHYDLEVTRAPVRSAYTKTSPIYTKTVLFEHDGTIEVQAEQIEKPEFPSFIETTFIESVTDLHIIETGDQIMCGLSGGRDSVAFLKLLERTRPHLPSFSLVAVTVTGLPDWEEPRTFDAALSACDALDIEHVVVSQDDVVSVFDLTMPLAQAANTIAEEEPSLVMVVTHHVMRRMIEIEAAKRGMNTIVLGLNADDLVASLVTWFTSGFSMGSIPVREVGPNRYIFPLYRITKKELTLYLECVSPELNRQGSPGRFTTGPAERSLAYAVTDHLYDLWPGIDYFLFDAFANMTKTVRLSSELVCKICKGTFLSQPGSNVPRDLCDVCDLFKRFELTSMR